MWDCLWAEGSKTLLRVAVALLYMHEDELLAVSLPSPPTSSAARLDAWRPASLRENQASKCDFGNAANSKM